MGRTNVDMDNGIRYGFIPANDLASHAWDTIMNDGEDLDYTEAIENLKDELARTIKSTVEDYDPRFDCKQAAEDIVDAMEFILESSGDCTRYKYENKGLEFSTLSDGDLVVIKSPYFTYCGHCSPCAPGGGYLKSGGSVKTYCLGPEWFDENSPIPYVCYRVSDGSPLSPHDYLHPQDGLVLTVSIEP